MSIDKSTRQHYAMQGKIKNYLGKQKMVKAPVKWKSGPDHPDTELAYITKAEKDLILKADLHNSLSKGPNRGPSGIISLNSAGSGYGGPGPGSSSGGGGGGGGGRDRWEAPAPSGISPQQSMAMTGNTSLAGKTQEQAQASVDRDNASRNRGTSLHGGPTVKEALKKADIKNMIKSQQEEKFGVTADPTKFGETVFPETLPKGHPDRIKEEAEEAVKQLSTKAGTKEALKEFKALKKGRQYVPDIGLLEKLGIKPRGILGSLVDTGEKYFDPKRMAFNLAKNYGMKKLGLGALNPWLGLLSFLPTLFGKEAFDPYKSLTNKFAKKPADMSAFNKLGLQANRVPTPTDTLTAKRARDNFKPNLKKNVIAEYVDKFTRGNKFKDIEEQTASLKDMSTRQIVEFKKLDLLNKMNKSGVGESLSDEDKQKLEQLRKLKESKKIGSTGTATAAYGGLIDRPLMGRSRYI